jgi:hypothetical protein
MHESVTPVKNRKKSVSKVESKENIKVMSLADRLKNVISNKNTGRKALMEILSKPVFK